MSASFHDLDFVVEASSFLTCLSSSLFLCSFTAWSSVREPSQVFTLLEVLYNAFDRIGQRRRIFKVETVGDCYVASCGYVLKRSIYKTRARIFMFCMAHISDLFAAEHQSPMMIML